MRKAIIITTYISLCLVQTVFARLSDYEKQLLYRIPGYATILSDLENCVEDLEPFDHQEVVISSGDSNALFRQYPHLQSTLSFIALGDLPTPIHYCQHLNTQYPSVNVYIKNDGITGKNQLDGTRQIGGNKLRKLQYLLADALAHGHDAVLTFGCVGSNHVLQTVICAKQLGLSCYSMLTPQPNSRIVRRNLLLQKAYDSRMFFSQNGKDRAISTIKICQQCKEQSAKLPYIIPIGGSIARGAIGYVEAAFELKEQIEAGIIPEPDHIYVTLGSGGTAAGLLLGCKAAGISARLHLVLVEQIDVARAWEKLQLLFRATNDLLVSLDETFPCYELTESDCCIISEYSGSSYGLFTPACVKAINTIKTLEGIELDGVYTGKCMSALLADLEDQQLNGSTILFWNTFCAEDKTNIIKDIDYHELPVTMHSYFENDVQVLDNY